MEAIFFKECNTVLKAEGCHDLPCYKKEKTITSVWELTDEDVRRILSGDRKIYLTVLGDTHPPIDITLDR